MKRNKSQITFAATLLTLLAISTLGQSQSLGYQIPKIEDLVKIPPSPEAQAFTKYGNTPVNMFTGSPDISIPIANLKGREISVPISLTYDASGIKVEQIATWVGLGWNLNVGGMVTRQVNGNPDDYVDAHPSLTPFYDPAINAEYEFVKNTSVSVNTPAAAGALLRYFTFMNNVVRTDAGAPKYEIQPDTYSFNALGVSGTLYIDYALGTAYCMEHPEIKAYPTFQVVSNIKNITAWKIVDGSGNSFFFELAERTYTYEQDALDTYKDYNSAWMLTRIESTNQRDIVDFTYSALAQWQQPQLAGRGDMRSDLYEEGKICGYDNQIVAPVPLYKIKQAELSSIRINGLVVAQFTPSTIERKDLKQRKFLSTIKLLGQNSTTIKRYKFIRSYFGDSTQTDEKLVRLRLDALEVYGDPTSTIPERYTFSYDGSELPSRESFAQDFWGYYNGEESNNTLIPRNNYYDTENTNFGGADRKPHFAFGRLGTLAKIKYPTGGTTQFNYRAHESSGPSYTYASNVVFGSATLTGGRDEVDPFGYIACDDNTNIPPKGVGTYFYVGTPSGVEISVTASGASMPGLQMQYVAIYAVPAHGMRPSNPPFCDVLNGDLVKVFQYQGTMASNFNYTNLVSLEVGHYRIIILNTNPCLTVSASVSGTAITNIHEVGGLRISSIVDMDDNDIEVSARHYYYGDLSQVTLPNINRSFIATSAQTTGQPGAGLNFEEPKSWRKFDGSTAQIFITCEALLRYSSNRTRSNLHVTYPVVTEVQFGSPDLNTFNGFTVSTFWNEGESSTIGYSKRTILNGRVTNKSVYNSAGAKVSEEQTYYSQTSVGSQLGFLFNGTSSSSKDTYVVQEIYNSNVESYMLKDPNTPTMTHCGWSGAAEYLFTDFTPNFHSTGNNSHTATSCDPNTGGTTASGVNSTHPAEIYRIQLFNQQKSPSAYHSVTSSMVLVTFINWNVLFCKSFSSDYSKVPFSYPRYWAKTDSTINISYNGANTITTTSRNTYGNTNHYQVTLTTTTDSKGDLRQVQYYYPHELVASNPSDPAWQLLIDRNRIAEVVKIESKYGNPLKPDFSRLTKFKSIATTPGTMIVPDIVQFSSGTGVIEDRIKYHQYDNIGNLIQASKLNDVSSSYLWAYNQTQAVAEVKGASSADFAYTSFEELAFSGGWAYTLNPAADFKTGAQAHLLNSFPVTRNGLTTTTTYVLSYWAKGGVPIISSGVQSFNDAAVAEADGWRYFEKTITGVISSTISAPAGPNIWIDELRIIPKGAAMTSYTYKGIIGLSSRTDPNNRITYFEYDYAGRLWLIKDHDKNIIKQNKYHFRAGEIPIGTNY